MGRSVGRALHKALGDYLRESSITGFQYISDPKRHFSERFAWVVIQLSLLALALVMVFYTFEDFLKNPLVVSLESTSYPIDQVLFPAISLCSINKISKRRATDYARLIAKRGNVPFDYVLEKVRLLGKLHDFEADDVNEMLLFQTYLEKYGIIRNSSDDYLYHIMKNLSTPCEELLDSCMWKGERRNCSDLFSLRRTYEGFCCTFNYIRDVAMDIRVLSSPNTRLPEIVSKAGLYEGLTVLVKNEPDDYFYPLISSVGFNIHIFYPFDYPDDTSGGLLQELVSIGSETLLALTSDKSYSTPEVRRYPIGTRACIFDDEVNTHFGLYSMSNCLVQCRMESIIALCGCVPFFVPWPFEVRRCSLPDLSCLNKYQEKWRTIYPRDVESGELEHEKQNSLHCNNCYKECDSITYHVFSGGAAINFDTPEWRKYENYSIIQIYYQTLYSSLYRQDVIYYWFEILSSVGGLLGIFLGISLLNIAELLYFVIFRSIIYIKWQ